LGQLDHEGLDVPLDGHMVEDDVADHGPMLTGGVATSIYIDDPDGNVVELRHYG
jgi:hypothetical protein